MPSRTIRPTEAPAAAPFAYTIGTTEGLTPAAVYAEWDGSGAGGDFLPCVSYYNSEGVLLDRAFPPTGPVTAGDTAEVGYRPFDRGGGGTAATPLETDDGAVFVVPTTELRFNAPASVTNPAPGVASIHIAPVVTPLIYARGQRAVGAWPVPGFPLTFFTAASNGVTVGPHSWTIQAAGVYELSMYGNLSLDGPAAANAIIGMYWDVSGVPLGSFWQFPVAIPAGSTWQLQPTLSTLLTLAVGNVIQFGVDFVNGTPSLGGPIMSLVRLGA